MGFATHLGSWLLGTVKNTTGTTAGTIQNLGATTVVQTKAVTYSDVTAGTVACVLPAGSIIVGASFLVTTAYATTTPTIALLVNGSAISAATSVSAFTTTGSTDIPLGTSNPALVENVGSVDAIVTFTQANVTTGAGAGTLVIRYVVRGSDGAMYPTAQQQ